MDDVIVYHKTVPNLKNQEKIDVLEFFSQGVKRNNTTCIDSRDYIYHKSKVGVIQGWVHELSSSAPHIKLRNSVINGQHVTNNYTVAIDSNLFLYKDTKNPLHYLRYSFNGVFPTIGIYCDSNIDPTRWAKISKNLNLQLKDYRITGDHILLCLQRNGGWSMGTYDVQDWSLSTITEIRKYSDRKIILRGHPGDKSARQYLDPTHPLCKLKGFKNVEFSSNGSSLLDDLKNAWAVVNHNSSPVVGAAIEGFPIFVTDPNKSQCKDIANTNLADIENPKLYNREGWVQRISMSHWNFDELKSGECWAHMKNFI